MQTCGFYPHNMTLKSQAIKTSPFWSLAYIVGTRRSKYSTPFFSTTDTMSFEHAPRWNDGTWGYWNKYGVYATGFDFNYGQIMLSLIRTLVTGPEGRLTFRPVATLVSVLAVKCHTKKPATYFNVSFKICSWRRIARVETRNTVIYIWLIQNKD